MEFKFHFYFSFFFGLVKWNSISISIFRFLSTCDIEKRIWISFFVFAALWKGDLNFGFCFSFSRHFEKRIWISFFVFRFRITLENGFEFRFSYLHCRLEFRLSFLHEFEKWINTSHLKLRPLPLRGWGSVWFSSIRFDSKLKIENQKFTIVIFNVWFLKNWKSQIYNLNCQFLLLRNIKLENNFQCFENQKLKIENGQLVVFISCF